MKKANKHTRGAHRSQAKQEQEDHQHQDLALDLAEEPGEAAENGTLVERSKGKAAEHGIGLDKHDAGGSAKPLSNTQRKAAKREARRRARELTTVLVG